MELKPFKVNGTKILIQMKIRLAKKESILFSIFGTPYHIKNIVSCN